MVSEHCQKEMPMSAATDLGIGQYNSTFMKHYTPISQPKRCFEDADMQDDIHPCLKLRRQIIALSALLKGPVTRERMDRIAKVSHSPGLVSALRDKLAAMLGVKVDRLKIIACRFEPVQLAQGFVTYRGVYALSDQYRSLAEHLLTILEGEAHD